MCSVKEMGYQGVELAGLYGLEPGEVKRILDKVGLTPISAHVPLVDMIETLEQVISRSLVDWPTECTGLGCSSQSWLHTATCLLTKSGFGTRRNRAAALVQGKHRPYVITTLC